MANFTVYSRPNCTYCDQAKALLKRKGLLFSEITVSAETMADFAEKTNGAKTVPQIFYHGETTTHVGGFDKLVPFVEAWWADEKKED